MKKRKDGTELTAAEAALQLGISRERVIRLVQTRQLVGRRDSQKGWLVSGSAIRALRRTKRSEQRPPQRRGRHG